MQTAAETNWTPPKTADEAIERMRADGDADPEGTARMNYPHLFAAAETKHTGAQS